MLKSYLKKLTGTILRGDAREESYYSILADLLNEYCRSIKKKDIHITVLPKNTEAGNPDFRVWDGKQHITGYIEAKDPTNENLDRISSISEDEFSDLYAQTITYGLFAARTRSENGFNRKLAYDNIPATIG